MIQEKIEMCKDERASMQANLILTHLQLNINDVRERERERESVSQKYVIFMDKLTYLNYFRCYYYYYCNLF
jgi:hypothetical protein